MRGRPQPWRELCPSCRRPDRRREARRPPGGRPGAARQPDCLCVMLEPWQWWLRMLQLSSTKILPDCQTGVVVACCGGAHWETGPPGYRQTLPSPLPSLPPSSQRSVLPSQILRTLHPTDPTPSIPPPRIFPG